MFFLNCLFLFGGAPGGGRAAKAAVVGDGERESRLQRDKLVMKKFT
jgi:hypothetical protein